MTVHGACCVVCAKPSQNLFPFFLDLFRNTFLKGGGLKLMSLAKLPSAVAESGLQHDETVVSYLFHSGKSCNHSLQSMLMFYITASIVAASEKIASVPLILCLEHK